MKIQEAINHAKEVGKINRTRTKYKALHNNDKDEINACLQCAEEHEQLAEWLEELQQYRAIGTVEECREARERRVEKKPNIRNDNGRKRKCCSVCGCFYAPASRYCPKCGQAIYLSE